MVLFRKRGFFCIFISFILLSFIYIIPAYNYINVVDYLPVDLVFHLNRMQSLRNIWHSPISYTSFGSEGNGVNYFYPWLTYYPAYLLNLVFHSLVKGYIAYIYLLTIINFCIAYKSMFLFSKSRYQSYIFSLLYTFSAYRAVDIITRNAVGEYIAISILPFVFYGFYAVLFIDSNKWPLLTIGMSALIYTHVLSTLLTSFFLLLILMVSWQYLENHVNKIRALVLAIIMCLLITAAFWLPMLQQQLLVGINRPGIPDLEIKALNSSALFNGSLDNQLNKVNFGVVSLLIFLTGCMNFKKLQSFYKATIVFTGLSLFLSTNLFPWYLLQKTPVTLIQFPWRFLGYASFFISVYGAFLIVHLSQKSKLKKVIYSLVVILLCVHVSSALIQAHNGSGVKINSSNETALIKSFTSTDYYPKKAVSNKKTMSENEMLIGNKVKPFKFTATNNSVVKGGVKM